MDARALGATLDAIGLWRSFGLHRLAQSPQERGFLGRAGAISLGDLSSSIHGRRQPLFSQQPHRTNILLDGNGNTYTGRLGMRWALGHVGLSEARPSDPQPAGSSHAQLWLVDYRVPAHPHFRISLVDGPYGKLGVARFLDRIPALHKPGATHVCSRRISVARRRGSFNW